MSRQALASGLATVPLAWLVLAVGLATSAIVALNWADINHNEASARLDAGAERSATAIDTEVRRYEDLLRAVGSLYVGSSPSAQQLKGFVRSTGFEQRFPGAQDILGVVPGRRGVTANAVRSGRPIDLDAIPAARSALRRSRDSGSARMSARFVSPVSGRDSLALFLPFYRGSAATVAQRRLHLRGWVGVSFVSGRFLDRSLAQAGGDVRVSVRDGRGGSASRLIGVSGAGTAADGSRRILELPVYGRRWTLEARPTGALAEPSSRLEPAVIAIFGVALSLLLFFLVQVLARSRERAQRLAEGSIARVLDLEERFRSLAATPAGIFRTDSSGRVVFVNGRFEEIAARRHEDLIGRHWTSIVVPGERPQVLADWRETAAAGAEFAQQFRLDGGMAGQRWVACRIANLSGDGGDDTGLVGSLEDVTERHRVEAELSHQARHDPLTGIPNRVTFMESLDAALAGDERVAVLFMDLDHFKQVNDTMGHDAGDRVLRAVARRLQGALRAGDLVGRFGGDEFTVLCRNVGEGDAAVAAARRMSAAVERPFTVQGQEVVVATSVGIALAAPGHTKSHELIRAADAAMYRAKGRNDLFDMVETGRT